jgi:Ca2+-binding RTX toxin-like protein
MTTTPTFWSNEVTLSHDPLASSADVTAVNGDTVIVGWSSGGDIFGFQLDSFGSFTGGNLVQGLTTAVFTPLSAPHFVQQSDGSVIVEYRETFTTQTGPDTDVIWHTLNSADPLNETPVVGSQANEVMHDVTATSGGGSAVVFETLLGGRNFQNLQFVNANGTTSGGAFLVGAHVLSNESQLNPSIAGLANGNVAVAYENVTPGAVGTPGEHDIRLHIYTSAGGDVAEGVSGSHEVMVGGTGLVASHPDIVVTNGGTPDVANDDAIVVAWQDANGIEFRRFTNERGLPLDQAPHLVAGSNGGLAPHVAVLNDGGFLVEWGRSFGQEADGSTDFGLVLQRFDKNGNAIGQEVIINNPGDQGPADASITTLEDGRVMLVFSNETGDSTNLTTLDYVILDPRDNIIMGTDHADTIVGRADGSAIFGLGGDDHLTGSAGNDTLNGGSGDDTLIGGAGIDTVSYEGAIAGVTVNLSLASAQNTGGAGVDTIAAIENLTGSSHNDFLTGNAGVNVLTGGLGRDSLRGAAGADHFDFNSLRDSVRGGNRDSILDFSHGQHDRIDLRDIDAKSKVGGNQAFHFIGSHGFTHHAGELSYSHNVVRGDVNGDGKADFEIHVNAAHLQASDFIL